MYKIYTVYQVTNKINGKYYIGVHYTSNPQDGYMGSGKAIKEAIVKYGKENFVKDIIFTTLDKKEAYDKEKSLTEDFSDRDTYNMRIGGVGGFTKENAKLGYIAADWTYEILSDNGKKNVKKFTKHQLSENGRKGGLALKGKPKSETHKEALREAWRKKKMGVEPAGTAICS